MNYRYTAVLATISNSFCDAILDYTVNKFNYYKVLLYTSCIAFIIQLLYGLTTKITISQEAVPYLIIHALFILGGYICFVKSLKHLPLGLVGLIESSNLFFTLFIDSCLGYIKITFYFLIMFVLFISSVVLFCKDCLSQNDSKLKDIKVQGFIWVLFSVLFYVTAPYLIKMADSYGANEVAINLSYYIIAIPFFCHMAFTGNTRTSYTSLKSKLSLLLLCLSIGILESAYYILETFSFIHDAPTIVMIIAQMRMFLIFILSVLFKMDKFTLKKTYALILGIISVIGVYYS